jgi:ArsR family transcriptional regulator
MLELCSWSTLHDDYPTADRLVLEYGVAPLPPLFEGAPQLVLRIKPGGSLLITELRSSHNQSWAREACGDL